eukprot:1148122-Pelagomonas_calceolata.AAC.4
MAVITSVLAVLASMGKKQRQCEGEKSPAAHHLQLAPLSFQLSEEQALSCSMHLSGPEMVQGVLRYAAPPSLQMDPGMLPECPGGHLLRAGGGLFWGALQSQPRGVLTIGNRFL